jgi:hypothetical protein
MRLKIIIGIIVPAIIIIALAILGTLNTGFSVDEDFVTQLPIDELFVDNQLRQTVKVSDVKITNNYFLTKRHTLPSRIACLIDIDGIKGPIDAGSLQYSEGDPVPSNDLVPYRSRSNSDRSVQVKSNEVNTISLYITPSYIFRNNANSVVQQYADYDELIIVDRDKASGRINYGSYQYYSCSNLDKNTIEEANHIRFVS